MQVCFHSQHRFNSKQDFDYNQSIVHQNKKTGKNVKSILQYLDQMKRFRCHNWKKMLNQIKQKDVVYFDYVCKAIRWVQQHDVIIGFIKVIPAVSEFLLLNKSKVSLPIRLAWPRG